MNYETATLVYELPHVFRLLPTLSRPLSKDDQYGLTCITGAPFRSKAMEAGMLWGLESPGEIIRAAIAELASSFAAVMNAIGGETR